MKKTVITVIIICVLLLTFSISVFSNNIENSEILNNENVLNSENQNNIIEDGNSLTENKTLEEQKQEVEEKLEESQQRIEYVQNEMTMSVQKVAELGDSITEYEKKYNELQTQIFNIENELNTTLSELEQIEDQYIKKERILKKRIVALYECGETTFLDVLISSKNLMDFLSNYYMLQEIIEYDNNLLEEITYRKNEIDEKKAKQEEKKKELRVARAKESRMKIFVENQKILQENYIIKLSNEERELIEKIEQYKKEQAEIERLIQESLVWSGSLAIDFQGGVMVWPVGKEGTYITSPFGNRTHPIKGVTRFHDGIDIGNAGFGAPIIAAADGVVTFAGPMGGYGNCVMIYHGDGIATLYGHGQQIMTNVGNSVKQGDVIMTVGSTGYSTGPHLHFEVRKNGIPSDPIPFLRGEKKDEEDKIEENLNNENKINNNILEKETNEF